MTRYEEFNDDRKSIVENIGLLLAVAGILVGFVATIWFDGTHEFWIWITMIVLLDLLGICLCLCIAQKFRAIGPVKWRNQLSGDPAVVDGKIFQQRIITSIDKIEKENTQKIEKLGKIYNISVISPVCSLITPFFSFF